jgi:hypothetical protein
MQIYNCMKGFSMRSPADWVIENRSGGCIRNTPLNCVADDGNKTCMTDKFYSTALGCPRMAKSCQMHQVLKNAHKFVWVIALALHILMVKMVALSSMVSYYLM